MGPESLISNKLLADSNAGGPLSSKSYRYSAGLLVSNPWHKNDFLKCIEY